MADAVAAAGRISQVGLNYLKNPMLGFAKEIIASGEIGEVQSFHGIHAEDYMADARMPWIGGWIRPAKAGRWRISEVIFSRPHGI
jgi:predicted dehydrogenase